MIICRFKEFSKASWGLVNNNYVSPLKTPPYKHIKASEKKIPISRVRLLPPATPQKIILIGLNYRDHAREIKMDIPGEPVIFLKPPTALIGHNDFIRYPDCTKRVDFEAELAAVISKKGKNISIEKAPEYIFGYTCLNDVTARDLQAKDGQWARAKSFDTFCPVGPWCQTSLNLKRIRISSRLNGRLCQDSYSSEFIFPIAFIISFVSRIMTLYPGDIISTGTPPGVGPMQRGDTVEVVISGIGTLKNRVV